MESLNIDELEGVTGGVRLDALGLASGSAADLEPYRAPTNAPLAGIGQLLGPIIGGINDIAQFASRLFGGPSPFGGQGGPF